MFPIIAHLYIGMTLDPQFDGQGLGRKYPSPSSIAPPNLQSLISDIIFDEKLIYLQKFPPVIVPCTSQQGTHPSSIVRQTNNKQHVNITIKVHLCLMRVIMAGI